MEPVFFIRNSAPHVSVHAIGRIKVPTLATIEIRRLMQASRITRERASRLDGAAHLATSREFRTALHKVCYRRLIEDVG